MKNLLLGLLSSLFTLGCQQTEIKKLPDLPEYDPNGVTYITVVNESETTVKATPGRFQNIYSFGVNDTSPTTVLAGQSKTFELTLEVPQISTLMIDDRPVKFFAYPNDTTVVTTDGRQIDFMGKYINENNYLKAKDRATSKLTSDGKYWALSDSLSTEEATRNMRQDFDLFSQHFKQTEGLSEFFSEVEKLEIKLIGYNQLIVHQAKRMFRNKTYQETEVDFSFIDSLDLQSPYSVYSSAAINLFRSYQNELARVASRRQIEVEENDSNSVEGSMANYFIEKLKSDTILIEKIGERNYDYFNLRHSIQMLAMIGEKGFREYVEAYKGLNPDTRFASILDQMVEEIPLKAGDPFPEFALLDDGNKPFQIEDLNGKVVLVNFWGTWCSPCIELIPAEQELHHSLENEAFEILNICINCQEKPWKDMIKDKNMSGVHVIADRDWNIKFTREYGIRAFPTYTLLDLEGKVITNKTFRPDMPQLEELIRDNLPAGN